MRSENKHSRNSLNSVGVARRSVLVLSFREGRIREARGEPIPPQDQHSFDELAEGLASGTLSRGRVLKLFGGAVLGLLAAGCGGSEGAKQEQAPEETTTQETTSEEQPEELLPVAKVPAERMYAGRVEGTDAFIGIALREQTNELIAYVCDGLVQGPPEALTVEAWFQGPIEGNNVSLSADGGAEQLQGNLSTVAARGTFTDSDGRTHNFEAEPVDPEGNAGLYWTPPVEGEGLSARGGTIILANAEEEERGKRATRRRKTGKGLPPPPPPPPKQGSGGIAEE